MKLFLKIVEWAIPVIALMFVHQLGINTGDARGYERAIAEQALRKDEHDAIMRKVGVCKWAQIMAEDIRCKRELP